MVPTLEALPALASEAVSTAEVLEELFNPTASLKRVRSKIREIVEMISSQKKKVKA